MRPAMKKGKKKKSNQLDSFINQELMKMGKPPAKATEEGETDQPVEKKQASKPQFALKKGAIGKGSGQPSPLNMSNSAAAPEEEMKARLPKNLKPVKVIKSSAHRDQAPSKDGQKFEGSPDIDRSVDNSQMKKYGVPQVENKINKQAAAGPSKLGNVVKRVQDPNSLLPKPIIPKQPLKEKQHNNESDNYSDDAYSDEGFEEDGPNDTELTKIKKAMTRENKITNNKIKKQGTPIQPSPVRGTVMKTKPDMKTKEQHKEGGFIQEKKIISIKKVDMGLEMLQRARAEELRGLVDLEHVEFGNMFEMAPQTQLDYYFTRLSTGLIQNQPVDCRDQEVDKDVQTEDLEQTNEFCQFPDDMNFNYMKQKEQQSGKKTKKKVETIRLNKFIVSATPLVEMLLEENCQEHYHFNKQSAAKRNPVEVKIHLQPDDIVFKLLEAKLEYISCINIFETVPQEKVAVSYASTNKDSRQIGLTIVSSVIFGKPLRYLYCENTVTSITCPDEHLVIVGTDQGSILIYNLNDFNKSTLKEANYRNLIDDSEYDEDKIKELKKKYQLRLPTYSTDGLLNYTHTSSISKLTSLTQHGSHQIVALDQFGMLTSWTVINISNPDVSGSEIDLTLSIGGQVKMLQNFCINLGEQFNFIYDPFTFEIDFHPVDLKSFMFCSTEGLFQGQRFENNKLVLDIPKQYDYKCLGFSTPTAISISDQEYVLVGFSCGSIAIFQTFYTEPISVWYNTCDSSIKKLRWCQIHFNEKSNLEKQFSTRLCEFFVIDSKENFYIWNMQKNIHKPVHVINFMEKHDSNKVNPTFQISNTCSDQSFYTCFALADQSVKMYFMNFKKGASISREKLTAENKKSKKILAILPTNIL